MLRGNDDSVAKQAYSVHHKVTETSEDQRTWVWKMIWRQRCPIQLEEDGGGAAQDRAGWSEVACGQRSTAATRHKSCKL